MSKEYLNRKEAAAHLGVSVPFLADDRLRNRYGIPFIRVGRRVFYEKGALDGFMAEHTINAGGMNNGN